MQDDFQKKVLETLAKNLKAVDLSEEQPVVEPVAEPVAEPVVEPVVERVMGPVGQYYKAIADEPVKVKRGRPKQS